MGETRATAAVWVLVFVGAAALVAWAGVTLAMAALVHGTESRLRRLEPDALVLLLAYLGGLLAIWSTGV